MEGAQTALINRGDAGPYMKLLPGKDLYSYGTQDESNYVELDNVVEMKSEGKRTLKVMISGEPGHLGFFKSKGGKTSADDNGPSECELNLTNLPGKDFESQHKTFSGDVSTDICVVDDFCYSEPMSPTGDTNSKGDFGEASVCPAAITGPQTELVPVHIKDPCYLKDVSSNFEDFQYTDMYLYKDCESEDCDSVVLSDRHALGSEDESHFITTHEIQLTELDHDVDGDFELESCTDVEDDNLVYSFVDYASFDSDETIGADIEDDGSLAPVSSDQALSDNTAPCPASAPAPTARDQKDLGDSDKCISSDESLSKAFQNGSGNSAGQIHLSIKTASRAINKSSGGKETEKASYLAKQEGDWSRYVFKTKDGKGDGTCGRANCFIPAPGRVHFGRKLKGRDFEYSSGASSSVSELDDADKEVRNLTARAFKSLACPYFDAISLSASSESSVSDYNWPALTGARKYITQKTSTSTFQASKNAGIIGYTQAKLNSLFAVNGSFSNANKPSSTTKKVDFKGQLGQGQSTLITLAQTAKVTDEFAESKRCANAAVTAEGSGSTDENTGAVPKEPSTEAGEPGATDSTAKKAILASSLLKDVISKKMQGEQEHRPEAGESGAEQRSDGALLQSENSAFRTWRNGEAGPTEGTGKPASTANHTVGNTAGLNTASVKSNKTSQLFVPKIQAQPKEQEAAKHPGKETTGEGGAARVFTEQTEEGVWKMRAGYKPAGAAKRQSPEIKISMRPVNDNKAKPFNIASLLTPNIGFSSANRVRLGDDTRSRALIASLKGEWAERVPHFMVRDVRDNKYKLLAPIHHVRDVRKLVKSSYHFVSLEKQEKQAASAAGKQGGARPCPERKNMALFSPMVIKCQSVSTTGGPDPRRPEPLPSTFKHQPSILEENAEPRSSPPDPADTAPPSAEASQGRTGQPPSSSTPAKPPPGDAAETQPKPKQDSAPGANANANVHANANASASGPADRRPGLKPATAAVALEKLQAAVRTMEELYVFDRNEWKRRSQVPRSPCDSHVLPPITRLEHTGPALSVGSDMPRPAAGKSPPAPGAPPTKSEAPPQRSAVAPGNRQKTPPNTNKAAQLYPPTSGANATAKSLASKPANPAPSAGIQHPKPAAGERGVPGEAEKSGPAPIQGHTPEHERTDLALPTTSCPIATSPGLVVLPVAVAMAPSPAGPPQAVCFARATPPQTTPPPADPAQQMQRKVLLDPATGQYYLVDTPVAPATRKLYDPETGQFMDVPAPPQPATPVSLSPLSPSPFSTPTYVLYPSLLPPPAPGPAPAPTHAPAGPPSRTLGSRNVNDGNRGDGGDSPPPDCSPQPQFQHSATRGGSAPDATPIISITSRQPHGPRILVPPSFDGTTMSFVVEHR